MTFVRLVLRNLVYHWRGNLAVLLGVVLGSAVLTGALLVGDSLRGSLRQLTLGRLGWVDEAMIPGRFFRAALGAEIPADKCAPIILLQGSTAGKKITILGVDPSFWPLTQIPEGAEFWQTPSAEVVLNRSLATALGVKPGDSLTLNIHKVENIPRETLLGKRNTEDVLDALTVTVRQVLDDGGLADFSLKPTPEPAQNIFVPRAFLQEKLQQPGRANALLLSGAKTNLTKALHENLTLEDWGLKLRTPRARALAFFRYLGGPRHEGDRLTKARWRGHVPELLAQEAAANGNILTSAQLVKFYEAHHPYLSLESQQLLLSPAIVAAAQRVAPAAEPILVYLADTLADGPHEVPYAVVAGVEPKRFLPGAPDLGPDDVALAQWPGSPLTAKLGNKLKVVYYAPDERNHLDKQEAIFTVRALLPMTGRLDDPDLTPEFPGITDKLDMASWENPPFPYSARRVKPADEAYWQRYRATPRAYVNLETAQRLWGSRFGQVTTLRIESSQPDFTQRLLAELEPAQGGFAVLPIRKRAEQASAGSNDFGVLFVGFSFFLIVSALLLVGLLFRLNLERRAGELGLLLALGWSQRQARRLLLIEGFVLALAGSALGLAAALLYAPLMLRLLQANWPGGASLTFLRLHGEPLSFVIGFIASLVVSVLTIWWASRALGKLAPRALLAGETAPSLPGRSGRSWSRWLVPLALVGALSLVGVGAVATDHEARAGSFFGSGALLLTAALAAVWNGLRRLGQATSPQPTVTALGIRNASRHRSRSLLTVGLLASATFVVVAVESFHKDTGADFAKKSGGSGGFALFAETDIPFFQDLNQPAAREELKLTGPLLKDVRFYPCRVRAGDDTSCLNLYQPLKPRLLSIAPALVQRGGFRFAASLAETPAEKENPWLLLQRPGEAIPAILDANTAQWVLHVPLGGTIEVDDEAGRKVKLRVVALLQESIYQSEVLVSEASFLKLYPRHEGFNFALLDTGALDSAQVRQVQATLQQSLANLGLNVQSTASRVRAYEAVENMYLATFQALGGLGLILGAVGLAIVLLRGVWERRAELALLRALGFRAGSLAWLVLAENLFLLVLGLAAGTLAALLAVAPHLLGGGADVLWLRIGLLLLAVLVVGLGAGLAAVFTTLRAPVLAALQRE
jgi:putative ABC transport system permease protein